MKHIVPHAILALLFGYALLSRGSAQYQGNDEVRSLTEPTDLVIIIGAGLAGATVAYELSQRSIPFLILEAADTAGGRTRQHALTPTGPLVEAGANWVKGFASGDAFSDFVANVVQLKMIPSDFDDAYFIDLDGSVVPNEFSQPTWASAAQAVGKMYELLNVSVSEDGVILNDMTAGAALLAASGWYSDNPLDIAALRFELDYEYAVPPSAMSLLDLAKFYDRARPPVFDMFVTDVRGVRTITDWHLTRAGVEPLYAHGPNMLLHAPVAVVNYSSAGEDNRTSVVVTLRDGRKFDAAAVVSTVPVGVLQASLLMDSTEHMGIEFIPQLPQDKKLAIAKFKVTDYAKIFIRFNNAVFTVNHPAFLIPIECEASGFLNVHNLNNWLYRPGENIIIVTATAPESREEFCLDEQMQLNRVLQFVSRVIGRSVYDWEVAAWFVPGWHSDPFARGALTRRTAGISRADYAAFNRAEGAIFFAGEAHSEDFHSYLQGAWESGKKTAADVAGFLKASSR